MTLWLAVTLLAASAQVENPPLPHALEDQDEGTGFDGIVAARAGLLVSRGFQFQAVRTDQTQATSKAETLFSAGALAGFQVMDHLVVLGSYEAETGAEIRGEAAGGYIGWREHTRPDYGESRGIPDEVMAYAGWLVGRIDVPVSDFGSFSRGNGFAAGLKLGWNLGPRAWVELFGEYRYIKYQYEPPVISGDTAIGGNTGWFGLGIDLRF